MIVEILKYACENYDKFNWGYKRYVFTEGKIYDLMIDGENAYYTKRDHSETETKKYEQVVRVLDYCTLGQNYSRFFISNNYNKGDKFIEFIASVNNAIKISRFISVEEFSHFDDIDLASFMTEIHKDLYIKNTRYMLKELSNDNQNIA